jgi:bifunctional non-homologous end joining protein LigD
MYATLGHALPSGANWTYEPKYDGMRVIAEASARSARIITRNGKDKSTQFPEIILALRALAGRARRTVVLDGEVVARPTRRRRGSEAEASEFQQLQGRMHLKDHDEILRLALAAPTTLVVFDLLRDGRAALGPRPWTDRRERLEALFDTAGDDDDATLRVSDSRPRGAAMLARARRAGWEGIIAKRTDARYQPGARSNDWLKLKLLFRAAARRIRRRRLHRPPQGAPLFRRAAARSLRPIRRPGVRWSYGRRLHARGAGRDARPPRAH